MVETECFPLYDSLMFISSYKTTIKTINNLILCWIHFYENNLNKILEYPYVYSRAKGTGIHIMNTEL